MHKRNLPSHGKEVADSPLVVQLNGKHETRAKVFVTRRTHVTREGVTISLCPVVTGVEHNLWGWDKVAEFGTG